MSQMVSPPREEDFKFNNEPEEGEEKMDMSLDQIIKLNRDTMMQSPVRSHHNSNRNDRPPNRPPSRGIRDAIRRSAASHSAAIRQGKLPERRGSGYVPLGRPWAANARGWNRNRNDMFKRSGLPRKHLAPGDKVNIYEGAAGKLKISVINENSKAPPPMQQRSLPPSRPRMNWGNDYRGRDLDDDLDYDDGPVNMQMRMQFPKVQDYSPDDVPRRHRTLDSLFASIKEQREFGRVQSASFGSGRFRAQSFKRRP